LLITIPAIMGDKVNFWVSSDEQLLFHLEGRMRAWQEAGELGPGEMRPVPRILHLIWLGSPLPYKFRRLVDGWRLQHPDYQVMFWDDAAAAGFTKTNQAAFDNASNWGERSDILRYEVLYQFGGLYVDTDYECLQSLDSVLDTRAQLVCGLGNNSDGAIEVQNGLLACAPGHPVMAELIHACSMNSIHPPLLPAGCGAATDPATMAGVMAFLAPHDVSAMKQAFAHDLAMRTLAKTGSGCLTRVLWQYLDAAEQQGQELPPGSIVVLPSSVFSAVPSSLASSTDVEVEEVCQQIATPFLSHQTLAVHWCQQSWRR